MNNKITRKKPKVDHIEIARQNIDAQFDGFRILHVSDLHNKEFGLNQSILIETTQEIKPDIIAFTGDIYFGGRAEKSLLYLEEAAKAAPVYFVTGNHEYNYNDYIKERLIEIGVNVLDNRAEEINKDGACLSLIGVDDFLFFRDKNKFSGTIKTLAQNSQGFKILLSHKPHFVDIYENSGADLVLSGHAHGGQIRLPFIGGLFSPGQGAFPRYTSGLYRLKNDVLLVVNRGLGDSVFPWRINNPPHMILITLKTQE